MIWYTAELIYNEMLYKSLGVFVSNLNFTSKPTFSFSILDCLLFIPATSLTFGICIGVSLCKSPKKNNDNIFYPHRHATTYLLPKL